MKDKQYNRSELRVVNNGHKLSLGSFLLENRIIMFSEQFDQHSGTELQKALLVLDTLGYDETNNTYEDIYLYINSYGGVAHALLGIYDTIQHIKSDVVTICTGVAMSAGALLLMGGTQGKRYALPNSRIMFHEMNTGTGYSKFSDYKIDAKENEKISDIVMDMMVRHAKKENDKIVGWGGDPYSFNVDDVVSQEMDEEQAKDWIEKWTERDRFLTPQQALNMGFIDDIIETKQMPHYAAKKEKK